MEGKEPINWEEVILNSQPEDIQEDLNKEPQKVFTLEEVEAMKLEMQRNSDKWVQKIISEKKVYEKAFDEMSKIADDSERLVELYEEDPTTADIILKKYFWDESIEEYKERIWYTENYADPKVLNAKIKKEAEKLTQNNLVEKEKQNFIDKLKMTDEEKEKFEEAFGDLKQLKSFNTKDLTKQFEKAYRLSTDNEEALSKLKNQETIAKVMGTWEWKGTVWQQPKKNNLDSQIEAFKKKHKL